MEPSPRLPQAVWVLGGIGFCVAVGFGVVLPVLPVYARTFGVSTFMVGAVVSSFALVRLLTTPLAPQLTEAWGEAPIVAAGCLIVGLSSVATGLADSYPVLLVSRAVGGIGSALFTLAASQLIIRISPAAILGRASSIFGGGFLLGGMAGPAIGGVLATISLTTPFFFYAATLVLASLVATLLPRQSHQERVAVESLPLSTALRDPRYRAALTSAFASGWQSQGARGLVVPLLVTEVLLLPAARSGVAFALASAAQAATLYGAGWLTDRAGRRSTLVAGSLLTAVLGVAFAQAGSFTWLTALLCLYGVGASLSATSTQASLGDAVGTRRGPALAAYQMAGDLGSITGPLAVGLLLDHYPAAAAMSIGAVLLLITAALAWVMPRRLTRTER